MTRMKNVDGVNIPFTAEEETAKDVENAAWVAGKTARNAQAEINRLENQITSRRIREAFSDPTWMNAQKSLIAAERAKL